MYLTRILAIVISAVSLFAGVYLLGSETVGENSYLETIAHGIGIYFLAKGLYLGPSLMRQAEAAQHLKRLADDAGDRGRAAAVTPQLP